MSWPGGEYIDVTVYVYDTSNNTPIPYATVTISDSEGYVKGIQATTDPNGYAVLYNVPYVIGDTYYITASAVGYETKTVSYFSIELTEVNHVAIGLAHGPGPIMPSGGTAQGNNIPITVYVYNASNNAPIPGAIVTISDSEGYISGIKGMTSPDGYVVFNSVPYYSSDTYYITAQQVDYNSNSVSYTGQQLAGLNQAIMIGLTPIYSTSSQPTSTSQQTTSTSSSQSTTSQSSSQPSTPSLLSKGTTIALIGVAAVTLGVTAYAIASRRKK
jgi:hypothetical protein